MIKKRSVTSESYMDAFNSWQIKLNVLHELLLDDSKIKNPAVIKGALNREIRAKENYEAARIKFLGIG